MILKVVNFC